MRAWIIWYREVTVQRWLLFATGHCGSDAILLHCRLTVCKSSGHGTWYNGSELCGGQAFTAAKGAAIVAACIAARAGATLYGQLFCGKDATQKRRIIAGIATHGTCQTKEQGHRGIA